MLLLKRKRLKMSMLSVVSQQELSVVYHLIPVGKRYNAFKYVQIYIWIPVWLIVFPSVCYKGENIEKYKCYGLFINKDWSAYLHKYSCFI